MLVTRGCEKPPRAPAWVMKEKKSSFLVRLMLVVGAMLYLDFSMTVLLNGPWHTWGQ